MISFFKKPITFGPFFASIPRGLLKLDLRFRIANLQPDAVSMLPRSLIHLSLSLEKQMQNPISNEHLEGLPQALQEFSISFDCKSAFDAKVFEILPKSICKLEGTFDSRTERFATMQQATEDFVEANQKLLLGDADVLQQ